MGRCLEALNSFREALLRYLYNLSVHGGELQNVSRQVLTLCSNERESVETIDVSSWVCLVYEVLLAAFPGPFESHPVMPSGIGPFPNWLAFSSRLVGTLRSWRRCSEVLSASAEYRRIHRGASRLSFSPTCIHEIQSDEESIRNNCD